MYKRKIETKLKDYQYFIAILLILSSYLYMGGIFNIYIQPSNGGKILLFLSLIMTVGGICLYFHRHRLKVKLEQQKH